MACSGGELAVGGWTLFGCLPGSAFWGPDLSWTRAAAAFCRYAAAFRVPAAAFSATAAPFWGSAMVAEGVKDVAVGLPDDAGVEKAIPRQGGADSGAA